MGGVGVWVVWVYGCVSVRSDLSWALHLQGDGAGELGECKRTREQREQRERRGGHNHLKNKNHGKIKISLEERSRVCRVRLCCPTCGRKFEKYSRASHLNSCENTSAQHAESFR
jgi:hypothetical protein